MLRIEIDEAKQHDIPAVGAYVHRDRMDDSLLFGIVICLAWKELQIYFYQIDKDS